MAGLGLSISFNGVPIFFAALRLDSNLYEIVSSAGEHVSIPFNIGEARQIYPVTGVVVPI